ncbi:hypothetical protein BGZ79_008231 [Entomortierella chlamydospora]|nr:hypothetical protein BGZ79_008231 [Entomortierella chlamydospora]
MASTKLTVTEKDIEWFNASDDHTPEAFFNHLKTINRNKAYLRYKRVLRDYNTGDAYRKRLVEDFDTWQSEEADAYWEERKAKKTAKSAQVRTAVTLARTSVPFAAQEIHATLSSAKSNQDAATQQSPGSKRTLACSATTAQGSPTKKTKKTKKSKQDLAVARRSERFHGLDKSRFWRLSSGKVVEETLYRASLESGASTSVRSYTIDASCPKTRALFTSQEWNEVVSSVSFQLPELHKKTLAFIEKLRPGLCENKHPYTVPLSNDPTMSDADLFDCNLAVKTAVEWHMLYTKKPSPFIVDDLSESWWARASWALLFNLLDDTPGIFTVDGEKRGLDSSKRRNMGRTYNPEESGHKKCGRKLDLICRDEVQKHDWLVFERMRGWDPRSTKFLRELSHDVVRETVTITHNRLVDVPTSFREKCVFVGGYSGSRGVDAFQIKPGPGRSYVLLMQHVGQYTLCPVNGELKEQFQGLVRLLQVRVSMKNTIELYKSLIGANPSDPFPTTESESDHGNLDWYYDDPEPRFDPNQVVSSSPIGPDDLCDLDDLDDLGELSSDPEDSCETETD